MGHDAKRIKSVGAHLSNDHRRGTNRVVGHFVNWLTDCHPGDQWPASLMAVNLSTHFGCHWPDWRFDSWIDPGSGYFRLPGVADPASHPPTGWRMLLPLSSPDVGA